MGRHRRSILRLLLENANEGDVLYIEDTSAQNIKATTNNVNVNRLEDDFEIATLTTKVEMVKRGRSLKERSFVDLIEIQVYQRDSEKHTEALKSRNELRK